MKKNYLDSFSEKQKRKLEDIVRHLIYMGYEMGKRQCETPYKYTCDTDKGEKYWKEILKLFSSRANV